MRRRAPITFTKELGWHVDLPTYIIVPESFLPITKNKIHADSIDPDFTGDDLARLKPTVEIEIPDDWPIKADGQLDAEKMRAMYRDHPRFRLKSYVPPVFL